MLLLFLAARDWPTQVDDQFITLAFAHQWAATGAIAWSTGQVVEGFSSFLQLTLATAAILFGLDANVFIKALAAASGATLMAVGSSCLRLDRSSTLLLLALALWAPLAYWSAAGMETTLFAVLVALGWVRALRGKGVGLLTLACFARPEGIAHLLCATRLRGSDLACWLAVLLWHGLRMAYFGSFWPTPFLVKVSQNQDTEQWQCLVGDLSSSLGILAALVAGFYRPPLRALAPLIIHVAVVALSEPDWMGHARLILPGVVATAFAWASGAASRPLGPTMAAPMLAASLAGGLIEPLGAPRFGVFLRKLEPFPWHAIRTSLDTPQLDDVVWLVDEVPVGYDVITADVGMPGNVPGVRIWDLVGLTDRDFAKSDDVALLRRFRRDPPERIRLADYDGNPRRGVPWEVLRALEFVEPSQRVFNGVEVRIFATDRARPDPHERLVRWVFLYRRYPYQGALAWHAALALADGGDIAAAAEIANEIGTAFPGDAQLADLPAALFAGRVTDPTYVVPGPRRVSRALAKADGLALEVDVEPGIGFVAVSWECEGEGRSRSPEEKAFVGGHGVVRLPSSPCGGLGRIIVDGREVRPIPKRVLVGLLPASRAQSSALGPRHSSPERILPPPSRVAP